jgi:hypothetical protein
MSDIGPVDYQTAFDIRPTAPISTPADRNHDRAEDEDRDEGHGEHRDTDAARPGPAPAQGTANTQHVLNVTA